MVLLQRYFRTDIKMRVTLLLICLLHSAHGKQQDESVADTCFCKLHGEIDDCSCTVESVDSFNNFKIFPRLKSLLEKDYFKYWKVNLQRGCSFWTDDSACVLKDCHVDSCSEEQIPEGLKTNASGDKKHSKYSKEANEQKDCTEDEDYTLGKLDTTISEESREAFKTWKKHDDSQDTFCELDDDSSNECQYVDLLRNPERYTGYKGKSAERVWGSIYNENCFKPEENDYTNILTGKGSGLLEGMCLEKRVFYRMISGLHTSISVHLTAMSYNSNKGSWGSGTWGPNVEDFRRRFDPKLTDGAGPQRLKNLYFTYLVELRALAKVAPYLEKEKFYTGNAALDADVQQGIKDLLEAVKSFPDQFDESRLFSGDAKEAKQLKEAFRQKFLNISRIMDCVGCDKCRLWGKLQITGMGTALKILFSGREIGPESTISQSLKKSDPTFQLRRSEIVALINAFGRLAKSIHEVEQFRKLLGQR